MSTEYYLCDDENRELFRLGKGFHVWSKLFPFEEGEIFTLSKVLDKMKSRIVKYVDWESDPNYHSWLYWKIVDWIGHRNICLISNKSIMGEEIFHTMWIYENYPEKITKFHEDIGYYRIVDDRYEK